MLRIAIVSLVVVLAGESLGCVGSRGAFCPDDGHPECAGKGSCVGDEGRGCMRCVCDVAAPSSASPTGSISASPR